jgi:hypothetical protein
LYISSISLDSVSYTIHLSLPSFTVSSVASSLVVSSVVASVSVSSDSVAHIQPSVPHFPQPSSTFSVPFLIASTSSSNLLISLLISVSASLIY